MKNYRKIACGLFIFISSLLSAQSHTGSKKKKSFHKQLNEITTAQIIYLKNGALLVRLKNNDIALSALRKSGNNVQADKIEKKQVEINRNIIDAFHQQFNFCPVYFFYSNYSEAVKKKDFDNVVFLNDSLQPDPSIKFTKKSFLIAHFGVVLQDTAQYLENSTIEQNGNFSVKQTKTYYGGPSFGYEGLVISSDTFVQLRHPFPYFVRTRDSELKKKLLNRVIRKMNKQLIQFYNIRSTTV